MAAYIISEKLKESRDEEGTKGTHKKKMLSLQTVFAAALLAVASPILPQNSLPGSDVPPVLDAPTMMAQSKPPVPMPLLP